MVITRNKITHQWHHNGTLSECLQCGLKATPRQIRTGRLSACQLKTILICAKCHSIWSAFGSPAICPNCQQASFNISVLA